MKRVYLSAVLLTFISVGCFAALERVSNSCLEMTGQAEAIVYSLKNDEYADSAAAMERLGYIWEKEKNFFRMIIGSRYCEELEQSLRRVEIWVEQKEKSPEALSELSDLILNIHQILQSQQPGLVSLL